MRRGSWSNVLTWCLVVLGGGCGTMPKLGIAVVPIVADEQTVLDGRALVLINLNAGVVEKEDSTPEPEKCLCGGTGRSGDGLGPCSCKPDCSCKKSRGDVSETVEDGSDPFLSLEQDEPFVGPKIDPYAEPEVDQAEEVVLEKLVSLTETLSTTDKDMFVRLQALEEKVKRLEEVTCKPVTGFTVDQAELKKKVTVCAVVVSQDVCAPCRRMDLIFPQLESSGWKIGGDGHIQRVKLTNVPTTVESADAIDRTMTTPFTAFYRDGKFVKGVSGAMTAKEFADVYNGVCAGK